MAALFSIIVVSFLSSRLSRRQTMSEENASNSSRFPSLEVVQNSDGNNYRTLKSWTYSMFLPVMVIVIIGIALTISRGDGDKHIKDPTINLSSIHRPFDQKILL